MLFVVGITGAICSGKSTICRQLLISSKSIGISVEWVDCDKLAHKLYVPGGELLQTLAKEFGPHILNEEDGTLDRRTLGGIVFDQPQYLQKLNSIVWPVMRCHLEKLIEQAQRNETNKRTEINKRIEINQAKVILLDAAVLGQAGWDDLCDKVLYVTVPYETAKARAITSRGMSEAKFDKIFETQQCIVHDAISISSVEQAETALRDLVMNRSTGGVLVSEHPSSPLGINKEKTSIEEDEDDLPDGLF
ncbi:dephospho-CoA kinase [Gregarina niphandrodes]|uniref:Dephospho-CoA kinase n=1 Tax=Gregarina niphandrodes TaxID=110365 RepID=A0A023BA91_GRENI|nr:dephospho-CoA kinase [Gregarina niphandrodes]EZG78144.1 dephospho-CoA kinase [Gregarina niphandrodes]|eukprot:XP_011129458.1 dephospho-CoA kinase [Gregarina niphandrodes]